MRLFTFIVFLVFSCSVSYSQTVIAKVSPMNWLSGCWESRGANKQITEQWTRPLGGMMFGIGQTVRNGKTVSYEIMRIAETETGLTFISKPSENRDETRFKLIKYSEREATFENPDHDFPQRIIYRPRGKKLKARIEGNNNGKFLGIDFAYLRVKCQ